MYFGSLASLFFFSSATAPSPYVNKSKGSKLIESSSSNYGYDEKTSLENKLFAQRCHFAIMPSCWYALLLTKKATNGLVGALLKKT